MVLERWLSKALWLPVAWAFTDCVASVQCVRDAELVSLAEAFAEDSRLVLVDKLSPRLYRYKRGSIVTLWSPTDPDTVLVRRLAGVQGDWVRDGDGDIVRVKEGRCWIESELDGPASPASLSSAPPPDSDSLGPVPLALIDARVVACVWPVRQLQAFPPKVERGAWWHGPTDASPPPSLR